MGTSEFDFLGRTGEDSNLNLQALEDGEDIQDLADRSRDKKDRRGN